MTNQVQALFYARSSNDQAVIWGLFETVELAEKELLRIALTGVTISGAHIQTMPVVTAAPVYAEDNPLRYPDVIGELILTRKILAIKKLRAHVAGMSLKAAKDAVERVNLAELPQDVRESAEAYVRENLPQPPAAPERWVHAHDWCEYDVLIDSDGSKWVRVGSDQYVEELSNGELPFRAGYIPQSQEYVEKNYGIDSRYDF